MAFQFRLDLIQMQNYYLGYIKTRDPYTFVEEKKGRQKRS